MSFIREHIVKNLEILTGKRSPRWITVRKHFIKSHPSCVACGRVNQLEVHHIVPFHINAELELDPGNLVVLCRVHHLVFGHADDWKDVNPFVLEDSAVHLSRRKT